MSKDDLGGFWKPDKQTREALSKKRKVNRKHKHVKRKNRRLYPKRYKQSKRVKGNSRRTKLCNMSSEHFYWTKEWRELRLLVLETYGYKCMLCNSIDSIQVDHIKPRSRAPHLSLTFENMQVLCKDCNQEKSNIHAEDYREEAVEENLDMELIEAFRERF